MAELTIPFWLASGVFPTGQDLTAWLKSAWVQPRWLDETIQLNASENQEIDLPIEIKKNLLQYSWQDSFNKEGYHFQAACREIATGERRMILFTRSFAEQTLAVLLAAPAAVGMYNLIPKAYVLDWFRLPLPESEPLFPFLQQILERKEMKPSLIKQFFLQLPTSKRPSKKDSSFAGATWANPLPGTEGSLAGMHAVVELLAEKRQKNGLAVEVNEKEQVSAAWLEMI